MSSRHERPRVRTCLQGSAASGAMKEELNNTLLACLAEEARSAHAAQEAIEFCRAAGALQFLQTACAATCISQSEASLPFCETEAGRDVSPTGKLARQGLYASLEWCCNRLAVPRLGCLWHDGFCVWVQRRAWST